MMNLRFIVIVVQAASIYAFENHPRCGRTPSGSSQHTTGRKVTTINHPWAVAIMKNQGTELHCSGSIISPKFILSAAHCMKFVDISDLELVLGASNLKDPANSEKGVIKKGIKDYKTHEKNVNGVDYDIAIIEVAEEIAFDKGNPRIWPICLPEKSNSNFNHLQFRGIKVVGYGPQDDEDLTLTSIDLTIKSIALCNAKYDVGKENRNYWEIFDSLPTKFNGGSIFCASNVGTDDGTCRGDSGGPALFSDGFKNQQLGVVHGSITSCDGSRFPSIFVRIDNPDVFNWISKVTSSGSVTDDGNCKELKVTGDGALGCLGMYTYINNLTATSSPDFPVYKMVTSTSVECGFWNGKWNFADSCGGCPEGNGANGCKGHCQWTDQKCISEESQRDPLDRYIYFHPDHEWYGAKGWRIGQKQHLSGENEGTYWYTSSITKIQFWLDKDTAWTPLDGGSYEVKVECIE